MSTAFEYALLHRGYDVSITSKLGEGGFGIVYAGVRLSDNTPIAVKYVHCTDIWRWHSTKNAGLKIPMEIHMLMRVKDINGTIKLYDWFKLDKGYVLVMERSIKTISLYNYLKTHQLSQNQVLHIFKRLVQIIYDCWMRCGIVHCDLKEENILINKETMSIKVLDFDFAIDCSKRRRRTYAGTPLYAPPEWHRDQVYYPETTVVWTLGVILLKLLLSESPFKSVKDIKYFDSIDALPLFKSKVQEFPQNVVDLLKCMLKKKISDRPGIDAVYHSTMLLG
uniref:Serine/threonine-protein kinase 1 n=1 Tax=Ixodes ricinus TaxID=34613 RepID=A0A0K8RKZ8_IXORI